MNTIISIVEDDPDPVTLDDLYGHATPEAEEPGDLTVRSKAEMEWLSQTVTDWS